MIISDGNDSWDFNHFKKFEYDSWVIHASFRQRNILEGVDDTLLEGVPTYVDLVTNFESLSEIHASHAICWQQLEAQQRPDSANWTKWENLTKEVVLRRNQDNRQQLDDIDTLALKDFQQALEDETREEYRQKRETFTLRLDSLVEQYKPDGYNDDCALDKDVIVYVHLALGLALQLEREEGRQGNRFWDLIESASRGIRMPKTVSDDQGWRDNAIYLSDIAYSMLSAEMLIWSCLFHKNFDDCKYEQALECFANAIEYSVPGWPCNYDTLKWVYGTFESEMDDYIESFFNDDYSYANQAHLVGFVVPMQKVADAFARIYEENSSRTNWGELASLCENIAEFYTRRYTYDLEPDFSLDGLKHFRVESEFFASDYGEKTAEVRTFWEMAKALTSQRSSYNEIIEELQRTRG